MFISDTDILTFLVRKCVTKRDVGQKPFENQSVRINIKKLFYTKEIINHAEIISYQAF